MSWRSRYAKQASRFLEPGERIQSLFCTHVRNEFGYVPYYPAFVVTDRAIIEIDRQSMTGRLTQVVKRHPRNIRLGPLSGWREFRLDGLRYEVPRQCVKDVAAADAALTEQATLDPQDSAGQQPRPGNSASAPRQIPRKRFLIAYLRVCGLLTSFFVLLTALSPFLDHHPSLRHVTAFIIAWVIVSVPLLAVAWFAFHAIRHARERHRSDDATPESGPRQHHLLWAVLWIVGGFLAGDAIAVVGHEVAGPPIFTIFALCAFVVWLVCGAVGLYEIFCSVRNSFRRRRAARTTAGA